MTIRTVMLTTLIGAAGAASAAAAIGTAQPAPSSAVNWKHGVMMPAWSKVKQPTPPRPGWTMRVTPPLPLHWDDGQPIVWVLYAYAANPFAGAADAERIARPFARGRIATIPSKGTHERVDIEMLGTAIEPAEYQGVAPMMKGAVLWPPVEHACFSITAPPAPGSRDAALIRDAYRQWLDTNGVIAAELKRDHAAFFAWVRSAPAQP